MIMSFRKPCHMLFRNLIPSFNLTVKFNNDFCGQTTTPKPGKSALVTRLARQILGAKGSPELTLNSGFRTGKTVHFPLNGGVSSTEVQIQRLCERFSETKFLICFRGVKHMENDREG